MQQVIIIIIYLCSNRVKYFPRYEASSHIPEHCPFRLQTKQFYVIIYTLSPSLPAPAHTAPPSHLLISTGPHSIIPTLMLQIPKPSQSAKSHHLSYTLNSQKTTKPHFASCPIKTHICLTIICSVLSKLWRFSAFIAYVSVPYVNAL